MALDIIILGVLRAGPVHGYELKRRVQRPTLGALSNNSIYPALRRFESDGFVTKTVEEQDGKPSRKVYAITDAGRSHFMELISVLPPDLATSDEEFFVRLGFFEEVAPAGRAAILAARAAVIDRQLAQVLVLRSEVMAAATTRWRQDAMDELIARLERERTWIGDLATRAGAVLTEGDTP
ncbi:MAG: PadR family transcriptional regulator [Microbacteriaceae bacterium]|nr:PadR family transcriptional regulator [Microbacteriaceae bacterium]